MFASVIALAFAGLAAAQSTIPGCSRDYTVQDGDYCDAISAAHNVSSYQLAVSNYQTINDGCTNLVPGQVICLGETGADCQNTYIVQQGDYCDLIAGNHNINSTLLMANNPQIDDNCYNLYVGEVLCVAQDLLVTPPPAGWTIPGSNLDDGDFVSGDDATNDSNTDNSNTDNSNNDNSGSTTTTTTAPATTTTKAATSGNKSSDNTSNDNTDNQEQDDTEDDGDCDDY